MFVVKETNDKNASHVCYARKKNEWKQNNKRQAMKENKNYWFRDSEESLEIKR